MSEQHSGPHTARSAPDTSRAAAGRVSGKLPPIRKQVLDYAWRRAHMGFTDEELILALDHIPVNSLRPRRSELTDENNLLDSGARSRNAAGNECVVWIHRFFHPNPPPTIERPGPRAKWTAENERAAIVAFMEDRRNWTLDRDGTINAIQRGEHRK